MNKNTWTKAEASSQGMNCVEVMETDAGFRVRDTKDGGRGQELVFTHAEWEAFLAGVANGEFDPTE